MIICVTAVGSVPLPQELVALTASYLSTAESLGWQESDAYVKAVLNDRWPREAADRVWEYLYERCMCEPQSLTFIYA